MLRMSESLKLYFHPSPPYLSFTVHLGGKTLHNPFPAHTAHMLHLRPYSSSSTHINKARAGRATTETFSFLFFFPSSWFQSGMHDAVWAKLFLKSLLVSQLCTQYVFLHIFNAYKHSETSFERDCS